MSPQTTRTRSAQPLIAGTYLVVFLATFVTLRLTGAIDWSWWWVVAAAVLSAAVGFAFQLREEVVSRRPQATGKRPTTRLYGAAILLIMFVALKLTGAIDWSWVWVLAPLWGSLALTLLYIVGSIIVGIALTSWMKS